MIDIQTQEREKRTLRYMISLKLHEIERGRAKGHVWPHTEQALLAYRTALRVLQWGSGRMGEVDLPLVDLLDVPATRYTERCSTRLTDCNARSNLNCCWCNREPGHFLPHRCSHDVRWYTTEEVSA